MTQSQQKEIQPKQSQWKKVATPTISYPNMLMTTQKIEIHAS